MSTLDREIVATTEDVDRRLAAAAGAADEWGQWKPRRRADALSAVADALDARSAELVAAAMQETGLAEARLVGEMKRTTVQLRMFADLLRDGSYLRVVIDRHDPEFVLGPQIGRAHV